LKSKKLSISGINFLYNSFSIMVLEERLTVPFVLVVGEGISDTPDSMSHIEFILELRNLGD
jgi:hypothetical protein